MMIICSSEAHPMYILYLSSFTHALQHLPFQRILETGKKMKNDRVFRMDSLRLFMNCDPFLAEKENICFKYILYLASYRSLLKIVLLID